MQDVTTKDLIIIALLSCLAGFVDGIGFRELGGFFVSFMSGNSTRLGVETSLSDWGGSWLAAMLIASFVIGAGGGVILMGRHRNRHGLLFAGTGAALALSAWFLTAPHNWHAGAALMACAMGAVNAAFRNGDTAVGLTYMTGALVKIGQRVADAIMGGPRLRWIPPLILWIALTTGAFLGAYAHSVIGANAVWIAAVILFALAGASITRGKTAFQ